MSRRTIRIRSHVIMQQGVGGEYRGAALGGDNRVDLRDHLLEDGLHDFLLGVLHFLVALLHLGLEGLALAFPGLRLAFPGGLACGGGGAGFL